MSRPYIISTIMSQTNIREYTYLLILVYAVDHLATQRHVVFSYRYSGNLLDDSINFKDQLTK